MSAFALEDGVVYHTYSAYARGLDGLWGMYQWLDRAPLRAQRETGRRRPAQLVPSPRRVRQPEDIGRANDLIAACRGQRASCSDRSARRSGA